MLRAERHGAFVRLRDSDLGLPHHLNLFLTIRISIYEVRAIPIYGQQGNCEVSAFFRRSWMFPRERLMVCFDDGTRVIVKDDEGNVFLNCSRWLFDQCWLRGFFEEL